MKVYQYVYINLQDKRIQNAVGFMPNMNGVKLHLVLEQEAYCTYEADNGRGYKRGYAEVYRFPQNAPFPQDDIVDKRTFLQRGDDIIPFSIYYFDEDAINAIWSVMMDKLETEVEI